MSVSATELTDWSKQSRIVPIPPELLNALQHSLLPCLVENLFGSNLIDSATSSITTDTIVKILMICRNCCGHSDSIMPMFLVTCDIPTKLFQFCRKISILDKVEQSIINNDAHYEDKIHTNCEIDSANKERIVSMILQLLSNFTAASTEGCHYLVMNHKHQFSDIFAAALTTGNRKIISMAISMVFNCLCSSKEGFEVRRDQLLTERLLFCQMFLAMYPQNLTSSSNSIISDHHVPENDPVAEWLSLLVSEVIAQGQELNMYNLLGSIQGKIFNLEQMTFLYIISSLEEVIFSCGDHFFQNNDSSVFLKVVRQVQQLVPWLQESSLAQPTNNNSLSNFDILNHGQHIDFVLVAMDYLSKLLCQYPDMHEVREILTNGFELVRSLCGYLEFQQQQKFETDQGDVINALLQLMSNLIYRCPVAQDRFLENKGLAIVLGMCGTNINQPLRREWSLMCIRNACETNERIRHFIESLQLQDAVVVNEKLKESGMQVEVDSKTGKLKFVPPTA